MELVPSLRQQAIYDAALQGGSHLLVQACAGSGKTSTLVGLCQRLPGHLNTCALAFNKAIADELSKRMPRHVTSCTMHSLGYRAVRRVMRNVVLDDYKLKNIIAANEDFLSLTEEEQKTTESDLLALVPLVGDVMVDPTDTAAVLAALEQSGRQIELPAVSLPLLPYITRACDETRHVISFSDMIRAPVVHGYPVDQFDVVLVDEAQDLNAIQHAFLKRIVRPGGMLIAVGDRAQAIYGFRGADPRSMDRLKREWGMKELPLDVSYRCPQTVVSLAQNVVGQAIQPSPSAVQGTVTHRLFAQLEETMNGLRPGDMVVCRVNAPLVPACLKLIRQGKKAMVRGRDIGAGLASLVRRLKAHDIIDLSEKLREWQDDQTKKAIAAGKPTEAIVDKAETLLAIISESRDVPDVLARIKNIFSDEVVGICLSTVHKAKGLEADRVIILAPEILPAPWAKTDEQKEQERNLYYVAVTRAKRELIFQPNKDSEKE